MGFLILSNQYPDDSHRKAFLRDGGPHARQVSPFHKPLAASASIDQWKNVLSAIRANAEDPIFLDDSSSPRPLRPNDDNYLAFVGPQWKPQCSVDVVSVSAPPAMTALLQDNDDSTPYPRYDRCAYCTKEAKLQCAKCKIVKYCCRDPCQSAHWKKIHKTSCIEAHRMSLWNSIQGNDGFWVSPEECLALQLALSRAPDHSEDTPVIRCFQSYFGMAAELGGCFVI